MKREAFTLVELLVVMAVIIIIAAIILAAFSQSKSSAKDVKSLSNLRQLGQAAAIYADANGVWPESARVLVEAKMVPKELLISDNDHSEKGLGNLAIVGTYNGVAPPLTNYKLSYGGFLEWEISPIMQSRIRESQNGGWLVDLSRSKFSSDPRGLLFAEGSYRRLLFDTAVVARRNKSAEFEHGQGRTPVMFFADNAEQLVK